MEDREERIGGPERVAGRSKTRRMGVGCRWCVIVVHLGEKKKYVGAETLPKTNKIIIK